VGPVVLAPAGPRGGAPRTGTRPGPPPCTFIAVEWEIAAYVGEDEWQVLGQTNDSDAEAALSAWIDEQGGVEGGSYGVRSLGAVAWEPFQVVTGVREVDEPG
jgi:hypothetical protein